MRVSLSAVKELAKLRNNDDKLVKLIGSRLAEVESIDKLGEAYQGLLVAEVIESRPHPDADKLSVYLLKAKAKLQVVAGGATRHPIGSKLALIPPGVATPESRLRGEPQIIAKTTLRGEESNGMLASARELGFSDDHEGVLLLDTDAPAGTPLVGAYGLNDTVLEVENKTLTHRPDCFGLIGFSREVSALTGKKFRSPEWLVKPKPTAPAKDSLDLSVNNLVLEDCPAYLGVVLEGVKLGPSPAWLQSQLSRHGIRPLNNVVDITNYLMILTGQPLHAFDYDKVEGGAITVRYPKSGEKIKLLDGTIISPHAKAVMIAGSKGPLALGGVMGGAESEISDKTSRVIIESANFDMYSVRNTSMKHGLFSEAVTRFARGQSPVLCRPVLVKAIAMIEELAGGRQASAITGSAPTHRARSLSADVQKINDLLGTNINGAEMREALACAELDVSLEADKLVIKVPFWRADLNIWQDVAEEVGRLGGFDNIEATLPVRNIQPVRPNQEIDESNQLRRELSALGANELLSYSALALSDIKAAGWDKQKLFRVANARAPAFEYIRPSLLLGLISKVHPNHKAGYQEFGLFELGVVHDKSQMSRGLPIEQRRLGVVRSSSQTKATSAYYETRYLLDALVSRLGLPSAEYQPYKTSSAFSFSAKLLNPSRSALVLVDGQNIGIIGEFNATISRQYKLPVSSAGFELDPSFVSMPARAYKPVKRFPSVRRDLTYEVSTTLNFAKFSTALEAALAKAGVEFSLTAKDIYQPEGKAKRLTYAVKIWRPTGTLRSDEVNQLIEKVSVSLKRSHSAQQI